MISDSTLLDEFRATRSEEAFDALMRRHGPMVMGVCSRILVDRQAAEDAFQATFLLLLEKCEDLEQPHLLANWLYGVAFRTASRIRARSASRHESEMREFEVLGEGPESDIAWREYRSILLEEISRLPEQLRSPLVSCYFDGLSHRQAARRAGEPAGSISGRLARAKKLLRERLKRRGLGVSVWLLLILLGSKISNGQTPPSLANTDGLASPRENPPATRLALPRFRYLSAAALTIAMLISGGMTYAVRGKSSDYEPALEEIAVDCVAMHEEPSLDGGFVVQEVNRPAGGDINR